MQVRISDRSAGPKTDNDMLFNLLRPNAVCLIRAGEVAGRFPCLLNVRVANL